MHKIRTREEPRVCQSLHLNWQCSQNCIRNIPKAVSCCPRALVPLEGVLVGRLEAFSEMSDPGVQKVQRGLPCCAPSHPSSQSPGHSPCILGQHAETPFQTEMPELGPTATADSAAELCWADWYAGKQGYPADKGISQIVAAASPISAPH